MVARRGSSGPDPVALVEIDLYGDLMIAASSADEDRLSTDRIDEVLRVQADRSDSAEGAKGTNGVKGAKSVKGARSPKGVEEVEGVRGAHGGEGAEGAPRAEGPDVP